MMNSIKLSLFRRLLFCGSMSLSLCIANAVFSQDSGKSPSRGIHILEPPTSAAPGSDNSIPTPEPPAAANGATRVLAPAAPPSPAAAPQDQEGGLHPARESPSNSSTTDSGNAPLLVPAPAAPAASEQHSPDTGAALTSTPPAPPSAPNESPTEDSTVLNPGNGVMPPAAANPASDGSFQPNSSTADLAAGPNEPDPAELSSAIKVPDPAGLSVQITSGPEIAAGSPVSFEITTKKSGYLILVDVNAAGKAVQIYPNPMSLMQPKEVREKANFIRPGRTVHLPDGTNPYSGFELVASPPRGTAMVVALLSERPVQLLDLPDLPSPAVGGVAAVEDFVKFADALRIPNRGEDGGLEEAHWSFAVTAYAVR
jgi:hypothetical protein